MAVFIGAIKKGRVKKIKISWIDPETGYKVIKFVTQEELNLLARIADITRE